MLVLNINIEHGSSVDVVTRLWTNDWGTVVSFTVKARDFYILQTLQKGSGAHPASFSMSTGVAFTGDKTVGEWSWQFTSVQPGIKNVWSNTTTAPYALIVYTGTALTSPKCNTHTYTQRRAEICKCSFVKPFENTAKRRKYASLRHLLNDKNV
jgi:hypothetical protein